VNDLQLNDESQSFEGRLDDGRWIAHTAALGGVTAIAPTRELAREGLETELDRLLPGFKVQWNAPLDGSQDRDERMESFSPRGRVLEIGWDGEVGWPAGGRP
jgi:hypothetical protein